MCKAIILNNQMIKRRVVWWVAIVLAFLVEAYGFLLADLGFILPITYTEAVAGWVIQIAAVIGIGFLVRRQRFGLLVILLAAVPPVLIAVRWHKEILAALSG